MLTIEFPGLWGLKMSLSRVAFTVFGYELYWYGIIISIGLMLTLFLALSCCEKYGIKKDDYVDFMLTVVPSAVIMARIYYVVFKWEDFSGDLTKIFNLRTGGLAIYGGVIGAVIAAYIFTKVKKYNTLKFFDFAVVYLPLGQAIGRWGNFFNQEAFGTNTTLPWGMKSTVIMNELQGLKDAALDAKSRGLTIPNMEINLNLNPELPVHPTFLYESLWNFILFFILLRLRKTKNFNGEIFALYMVGYGIGRFIIEGLRTDSLMYGEFRVSQILALTLSVVFVIYIIVKRRGKSSKVVGDK
jgi:phosphatidylglycerol:prolipoprotein diacylglycerol transferase